MFWGSSPCSPEPLTGWATDYALLTLWAHCQSVSAIMPRLLPSRSPRAQQAELHVNDVYKIKQHVEHSERCLKAWGRVRLYPSVSFSAVVVALQLHFFPRSGVPQGRKHR